MQNMASRVSGSDSGSGETKARFYYGWVMVVVAAVLMAATLPGRTHGMGLITKRLIEDIDATKLAFAQINFWATLIGASFCLPCGWLIDRFGLRRVSIVVIVCLAVAVIAISRAESTPQVALWTLLTRGFGQSMLSVLSITLVGKWFSRRLGMAMGVYSVLLSLMMATATGVLGSQIISLGWREAWSQQGWVLLVIVLPLAVLIRNSPNRNGAEFADANQANLNRGSATLRDALSAPCFWVFALSISFFGLISSGLSLFNQYVLAERGFDESVYHQTLVIGLLAGLFANLATGAATRRFSLQRLLSCSLLILTFSLVAFPFISSIAEVYAYAISMGVAGGMLTVLFFTVWGHGFGPDHLGKIQGAAQMITVLASALGPVMVTLSESYTGSYTIVFYSAAIVTLIFAAIALLISVPDARAGYWQRYSASYSQL